MSLVSTSIITILLPRTQREKDMSQQSGRTMRESEENGNGNGHKQQKEEEQAKKRTVHVVQVFGFA